MATSTNPRKKKLGAICTKIAMFYATETYRDEEAARKILSEAIELIDKASALLVAADEQEQAKANASASTASPTAK